MVTNRNVIYLINGICSACFLGEAMKKVTVHMQLYLHVLFASCSTAYLLNSLISLSMIFVISKQCTTYVVAFFKRSNNYLFKKILKGDELKSPIIAVLTKLHHPSHLGIIFRHGWCISAIPKSTETLLPKRCCTPFGMESYHFLHNLKIWMKITHILAGKW